MVKIWVRAEYDAVFNFSCICSCNLTKSFTFYLILIFFQKNHGSEFFKQSTCILYASEILLVKVFINACRLTGEMPIGWRFFLGVWHYTGDWNYIDHQHSESISNKNLSLHWQQNSCPGTALIFLFFSCWAIWRVITCSPLTLRRCFINTAQYLLFLLSKTLPNTCS